MRSEEYYMDQALRQARKALEVGEVPVGAVVVDGRGAIVGRGYNAMERYKTQQAHAELRAIARAVKKRGDWRLDGCTLYVTLEPCVMCLGAALLSRMAVVVYGAPSPQFGAEEIVGSFPSVYTAHTIIRGGLREQESSAILKRFFQKIRIKQKEML